MEKTPPFPERQVMVEALNVLKRIDCVEVSIRKREEFVRVIKESKTLLTPNLAPDEAGRNEEESLRKKETDGHTRRVVQLIIRRWSSMFLSP